MLNKDRKVKTVFLIGFLFSFHLALTAYVNSTFLSTFLKEEKVGLIYAMASAAAIVALLIIPRILSILGGYRFLLYTSFLSALSLLSLSLIKSTLAVVVVFIVYFTLNILIVFILDELLEIFSRNAIVGKVRGLYLTIMNSAWILAQVFSGKVLNNFSLTFLYFIAFIIMLFFLLIVLVSLRKIPDPNYDKTPALKSVKKFLKNKNLVRSYKISFLLQFFYSWMVIYTPIYLSLHLGFTWPEITTIFSIMLLPFVLFQYPLGRYSDKVGQRKMMMLGFLIASLATTSLFFITKHSIWIWTLALFSTRVGASIVEVMSDVYFFKHIDKEDDDFIGIYRNTRPTAYILAPLIASGLFFLIPSFKFIFLILGILMLSGVYIASTTKKNDI